MLRIALNTSRFAPSQVTRVRPTSLASLGAPLPPKRKPSSIASSAQAFSSTARLQLQLRLRTKPVDSNSFRGVELGSDRGDWRRDVLRCVDEYGWDDPSPARHSKRLETATRVVEGRRGGPLVDHGPALRSTADLTTFLRGSRTRATLSTFDDDFLTLLSIITTVLEHRLADAEARGDLLDGNARWIMTQCRNFNFLCQNVVDHPPSLRTTLSVTLDGRTSSLKPTRIVTPEGTVVPTPEQERFIQSPLTPGITVLSAHAGAGKSTALLGFAQRIRSETDWATCNDRPHAANAIVDLPPDPFDRTSFVGLTLTRRLRHEHETRFGSRAECSLFTARTCTSASPSTTSRRLQTIHGLRRRRTISGRCPTSSYHFWALSEFESWDEFEREVKSWTLGLPLDVKCDLWASLLRWIGSKDETRRENARFMVENKAAMRDCVRREAGQADLALSVPHQLKGVEFGSVVLADRYELGKSTNRYLASCLHVAATRATTTLELNDSLTGLIAHAWGLHHFYLFELEKSKIKHCSACGSTPSRDLIYYTTPLPFHPDHEIQPSKPSRASTAAFHPSDFPLCASCASKSTYHPLRDLATFCLSPASSTAAGEVTGAEGVRVKGRLDELSTLKADVARESF
ncbi:hypothetical protein JCM10212_007140 [Sporobolomyces blumeae]